MLLRVKFTMPQPLLFYSHASGMKKQVLYLKIDFLEFLGIGSAEKVYQGEAPQVENFIPLWVFLVLPGFGGK